jgi:hypothetical protein
MEKDIITSKKQNFYYMNQIGKYRDGLLVTVSIIYIVGYCVWSYTAFNYRIGMLPALDAQYFLAGVIPSITLFVTIYALVKCEKFFDWVTNKIGSDSTGYKKLLRRIIIAIFFAIFALAYVYILTDKFELFTLSNIMRNLRSVTFIIFFIITPVIFTLFLPKQPSTMRSANRYSEFIKKLSNNYPIFYKIFREFNVNLTTYFIIIFFCFASLGYYLKDIYPKLPQEFGGPKPRIVFLDINSSQISTETLSNLTPLDSVDLNVPTVRSNAVELLFSNNNNLIVRTITNKADSIYQIYELPRTAVVGIHWTTETTTLKTSN